MSVLRESACELVGSGFLLISIVGSGIMGQNLSGGNRAVALLCNSIAAGGALAALILTFGSLSHLLHLQIPAVALARAFTDTFSGIRPSNIAGFWVAQFIERRWQQDFLSGFTREIRSELPVRVLLSMRQRKPMSRKKRVLILCTGNSARSQMAEGLLRNMSGDRFEVQSAGTNPKGMHPQTVIAMKEIGIDVRGQRSKDVREFEGQKFDYVITVCDRAKQNCPIFPGAEPVHWDSKIRPMRHPKSRRECSPSCATKSRDG
jgi:arsenate reductase